MRYERNYSHTTGSKGIKSYGFGSTLDGSAQFPVGGSQMKARLQRALTCLAILGVAVAATPDVAKAVTLNPGDILVADLNAFGGPGAIFRVDPTTGAQTTISSGGNFVGPAGIAIVATTTP